MKTITKIILVALIAGISSCTTKIPYVAVTNYIDYEPYSKQGIFITEANSVSFDYTPMGSVTATIKSGYEKKTRVSNSFYTDYNGVKRTGMEKYDAFKAATPEDGVALMVESVKEKGGNGIINFHIAPITEIVDKEIVCTGYLLTGMAIKK